MFQNISDTIIGEKKYSVDKKERKKIDLFTNVFALKNIPIYIVAFMISMVGIEEQFVPLSISVLGACISNSIPLLGVVLFSIIGSAIKYGVSGALTYILMSLVLILTMLIIKPIYTDEEKNEKLKLGKNIFISVFVIELIYICNSTFTLYDVLTSIALSIITVVFYKIFVNSVVAFSDLLGEKAFSIEEILGASLMTAIAVGAFGELSIYGFSIRNILSILIVLILGWKHGVLVGTTAGVTIGVTVRCYYIFSSDYDCILCNFRDDCWSIK